MQVKILVTDTALDELNKDRGARYNKIVDTLNSEFGELVFLTATDGSPFLYMPKAGGGFELTEESDGCYRAEHYRNTNPILFSKPQKEVRAEYFRFSSQMSSTL